MSTIKESDPGDTSMATVNEVEKIVGGGSSRIVR